MVAQQDLEGFGGCTNIGECSAACPKGISMETISRLNHDLLGALRAGVRPKS
jgi:succinate dehydrogenase / fumarate reductase iron-sulfur subunit